MLLRILLCLLFSVLASASIAQSSPDVFQLNRTAESKTCFLPSIYFKVNSAEVEDRYLEEMAFIAYLMKKYRKIKIKIRAEIIPNPYDTQVKLLTEERISYFTWLMEDRFGIKSKRIVSPKYTHITRGYTPYQSTLALDRRKLRCDCVWKGN